MTDVRTVRLGELEHDPVAVAGHEARLGKIDDLLASIPAKGLLQSLSVRPATDGSGKLWVKAGNRRLATLRKLRDEGGLVQGAAVTDDFAVAVIERAENDADAYETSRSENMMRLPEGPVEEFRAFAKMAETTAPAEIAARFGIPERRVQQRLKLAGLHPEILDQLEAGKLSMDEAQAFTIEPDQKKQFAVFKKIPEWQRHASSIRSALTTKLVRADSKLAKFITKKRYEAAGGKIYGDVFDEKASYWISPDVIDKCVADAWATQKAKWVEEGWSFIEEAATFGQNNWGQEVAQTLKQMEPERLPLSTKQQGVVDRTNARLSELETAHPSLGSNFDWDAWYREHTEEDEEPDVPSAMRKEHATLTSKIRDIERSAPRAFTSEQKAAGGVVYYADSSREPRIGVLRPGAKAPKVKGQKSDGADKPAASLDEPGTTVSLDLSRRVTKALKEKLAREPMLALRVLLASIHSQTFSQYDRGTPLTITAEYIHHADEGEDPEDRWDRSRMTFAAALDLMIARRDDELLVALAPLLSMNLTVADGTPGARNGRQALVDFIDPNGLAVFDAEVYFSGVTKPLIQLAWREMMNPMAGDGLLADGKKAVMAAAAAKKARATGWLPPQLRSPSYAGPGARARVAESEAVEHLQAAE
jgi:ParB family chromosome partitioning protein